MPQDAFKMDIDDVQLSSLGKWARTVSFDDIDIKAGVFPGKYYKRGTKRVPLAKVALINEYGAPKANIPPRPIMRFAKPRITKRTTQLLRTSIIKPGRTIGVRFSPYQQGRPRKIQIPDDVQQKLGEIMVDELRRAIVVKQSPPNTPATIRKKGFDKPLIRNSEDAQRGI